MVRTIANRLETDETLKQLAAQPFKGIVMETITAERAKSKLLIRNWQFVEGYWRPTIATVEDNPQVIPGNYTMEEALAFYGYKLEED